MLAWKIVPHLSWQDMIFLLLLHTPSKISRYCIPCPASWHEFHAPTKIYAKICKIRITGQLFRSFSRFGFKIHMALESLPSDADWAVELYFGSILWQFVPEMTQRPPKYIKMANRHKIFCQAESCLLVLVPTSSVIWNILANVCSSKISWFFFIGFLSLTLIYYRGLAEAFRRCTLSSGCMSFAGETNTKFWIQLTK